MDVTPADLTDVTPADVVRAADRIRPYARRTPLLEVEVDGRRALLKLEHLQLSGSFKLRGALNALLSGGRDEHIVTASGGNHGLAVATAAARLGMAATVFVPTSTPSGKARRIESMGARLERRGGHFAEAAVPAQEFAARPGHRFVHPYDEPQVVAGQGTLMAEIVADRPEVDTVAVAAGGGGLAAGTALAAGGRRTVVVEPEGCRSLHDALAAGHPVDSPVDTGSAAASALGASRIGDLPYAILAARSPLLTLVDDKQILAARDRLWEEFRIAAEPAAALPFAAWLAGHVPGELPCLVVCGANTDWEAR
ncbi:serine/threonine dehydratase [Streptomyces sp. NA04227]|nr:serine/threonine dehydratase [Streptomyces sp. NA04227]